MKKMKSLSLPLILSIFAAIVVITAIALYNNLAFATRLELNGVGVFTLAIIAFSITFLIAWLGIKTQNKTKHTPSLNAVFGIIWGSIAFALIASVSTFVFLPSMNEFWRVFEFTFITGFFLGGFLGPIIGGTVGYWLTKQTYIQEKN